MITTISNVSTMPGCPFGSTGVVFIIITPGIPTYFHITGMGLTHIESIRWFPENPSTVKYIIRDIVLLNDQEGSFVIEVIDNSLDPSNRHGSISFSLSDGNVISFHTSTFGPVTVGPLWQSPQSGINTGIY